MSAVVKYIEALSTQPASKSRCVSNSDRMSSAYLAKHEYQSEGADPCQLSLMGVTPIENCQPPGHAPA